MSSPNALCFSPVDLYVESVLSEYDAAAHAKRLNEAVTNIPEADMTAYVVGTDAIQAAADEAKEIIAQSSMNAQSARIYFRNAVRAARAKVRM